MKKYTCTFPPCGTEFFSDSGRPYHCSDECRRAHQVLEWAGELLRLRREGKSHREVGDALGISKNAALHRALRLQHKIDKYPSVALALKEYL